MLAPWAKQCSQALEFVYTAITTKTDGGCTKDFSTTLGLVVALVSVLSVSFNQLIDSPKIERTYSGRSMLGANAENLQAFCIQQQRNLWNSPAVSRSHVLLTDGSPTQTTVSHETLESTET